MRNANSAPSQRHFDMLLFEGFSNLCLANAVEPLRAANTLSRRSLYGWRHVGLSGRMVTSSSGLPVHPQALAEQPGGDYLFVLPSYGFAAQDSPACRSALRAAARRYGGLVGLDTGSWLLAAAGLLDGYRATSHWDVLGDLAERFPEVTVMEDRHVIDRDRASCGGATTTLELMLDLIERHHGAALALEVAALFMYGERDPRADPLLRLPPHRLVRAAAGLMRRHVETPLSVAEVARRLGMGQRALEKTFRAHAGGSPARVYRSIRLAEARRRLEQTRESVMEIAQRCGYQDPTALARAFRAEFGLSPSAARLRVERGA
jgi:transcriptional regulator GlxA family with amidase domain